MPILQSKEQFADILTCSFLDCGPIDAVFNGRNIALSNNKLMRGVNIKVNGEIIKTVIGTKARRAIQSTLLTVL